MDVKSSFLNGILEEEVFVEQQLGFIDPKARHKVYKLHKALYGLKQAPLAWYNTLSEFLLSNKFHKGKIDPTLFIKESTGHTLIVQIYVDDIIFGSTNQALCEDFSRMMQKKFAMSMMGELRFFLGIEVTQLSEGTFISQSKYTKDLLRKYHFNDATPMKTPIAVGAQLDLDEEGESFDETEYRGMIGSLLYLTASRPDIMFATCICARYQARPKLSHYQYVTRIFRYLKGTPNLGLWYPKNTDFNLIGYSDSDFAGCKIDRKSTTGTCQFLGDRLVSWFSKKQSSVSTSTAEAEYIAAGSCCAQLLWMQSQLSDYGFDFSETPLYCDNTSAIAISNNPIMHSKSKHIELRHHFIRDHITKKHIALQHVSSESQLADIFTKPLPDSRFSELLIQLGMLNHPH